MVLELQEVEPLVGPGPRLSRLQGWSRGCLAGGVLALCAFAWCSGVSHFGHLHLRRDPRPAGDELVQLDRGEDLDHGVGGAPPLASGGAAGAAPDRRLTNPFCSFSPPPFACPPAPPPPPGPGAPGCPSECGQSVACIIGAPRVDTSARPFWAIAAPGAITAELSMTNLADVLWEVQWTSEVFATPDPEALGYEINGHSFEPCFPELASLDLQGNTTHEFVIVIDGIEQESDFYLEVSEQVWAADTLNVFKETAPPCLEPIFRLTLVGAVDTVPPSPPGPTPPSFFETFTCDDGCVIAGPKQNDNYCDCTGCEDEADWVCSECIEEAEELGLGLATASVAVGVGVGVGVGTAGVVAGGAAGGAGSAGAAAAAAAAAFASVGKLKIRASQDVLESSEFQSAVRSGIARLAGVAVGVVELIVGCLAAGRRLIVANEVEVCFRVESESRELSEQICRRLSFVQLADVQRVIAEELLDSTIDPSQVDVVYYNAEPNPLAPTNPNAGRPTLPFNPGAGGISLG